jgi:Alginate lyase
MGYRRLLVVALVLVASTAAAVMSLDSHRETGRECRAADARENLAGHRGLFLDAGEIAAIRALVAARQEPWASGYARLLADADAALALEPPTVVDQGRPPDSGDPHDYSTDAPYAGTGDGIINPLNDRTDYRNAIAFSHAVRDLGLGYALTGEERYARKAIELIEVWMIREDSRMTPAFTNRQSRIELSVTMPGAFYGLDLIWHYPAWDEQDRQAVIAWARALGEDSRSWAREGANNFENWRLVLAAGAAAVAGEGCLLSEAFAEWQELLATQMDEEGKLVFELDRSRSLSYSTYAIKAMMLTAEIARHHGAELYGYRLADGRGLELALDYHAPYLLDPAAWPGEQISDYTAKEASIYELAYAFAQKPAYLEVIRAYRRPFEEDRVLGPITLTHAHGAYPFARPARAK